MRNQKVFLVILLLIFAGFGIYYYEEGSKQASSAQLAVMKAKMAEDLRMMAAENVDAKKVPDAKQLAAIKAAAARRAAEAKAPPPGDVAQPPLPEPPKPATVDENHDEAANPQVPAATEPAAPAQLEASTPSAEPPPVATEEAAAKEVEPPPPVEAAAPPSTATRQPASYRLKRGETMSTVSKKVFGSVDDWPKLWAMNPEIFNPHQLPAGTVLRLTKPEETHH